MDTVVYPYLGLYVLLLAVALSIPALFFARRFVIKRRFVCPEKKRDVQVDVVCRRSGKKLIPMRVKSCTAFPEPRRVTCEQKCLKLLGVLGRRRHRAKA